MRTVTIVCKEYSEKCWIVASIQKLIKEKFADLFIGVIVHGSIAKGENISYSDFDGLLLVKDTYKNSRILKTFIKSSMKLIYQFDSLQHHEWFIIYEDQLKDYPQTYFPHELFEYSRVIYPSNKLKFEIQLHAVYNYMESFEIMAASIVKKIELNYKPRTMYQLKSLLSQIMLLPTLYAQARHRKGIFKKYSFGLVRSDFSYDAWQPIDLASEIRQNWECAPSRVFKMLLRSNNILVKKLNRVLFAPKIPTNIKELNIMDFYAGLKGFIDEAYIILKSERE